MGFRLVEETEEQELGPQIEEEGFRLVEEDGPPGSSLTRQAGQYSARGIENILGIPQALGEFGKRLQPKETILKGAEKIGLREPIEKAYEISEKYSPLNLLPSSEQVREAGRTIFGEAFEPQSAEEEFVGDVVGEGVALAFPFGGALKPTRALLTSTAANAAKKGAEWMGLGEKGSNYAKIGTYLMSSFLHPKAAQKFYNKKYSQAQKNLSPDSVTASKPFLEKLSGLKKELELGGISSVDAPSLKAIKNLEKGNQGAMYPIQYLEEAKKKMGVTRQQIKQDLKGNKAGIKMANRKFEKVMNAVDTTLEKYATENPKWGKPYMEANNAFAASKQSEGVKNFLKNNYVKFGISHLGLSALLGSLGGLPAALIGAAAASYPVYKTAQNLSMIQKSPPLRREFFKLYNEALKGNVKGAATAAHKLGKALPDEDS